MTTLAYFNGEIVPIEEAKVSVMTCTLNYGIGAFGGLRAYWSESRQELFGFRWHDHYTRFLNSTKLLMADLPYTVQDLVEITTELLAREGWRENCYIRPLYYQADTKTSGVRLHDMQDAVTIFAQPQGKFLSDDQPISVCVSSWRRVDDTAIPARGKIVGSYVNSALIRSDAILNGFRDAIVLNQDGHVSEGSVANFMMVRDGVLLTPPVTANVLEGITRRTVLHLAHKELGVPVVERQIDRTELYLADEAFFCGTGMQITPIGYVDHRAVGDSEVGPITQQIRDLYFRVVKGEVVKYEQWLTPVPVKVYA